MWIFYYFRTVLNWKQIGWKRSGNNSHSNPSNKKYFYKAGSHPLVSLARKGDGSFQHTFSSGDCIIIE